MRVGIVCGRKASDAALCRAMLAAFPDSVVVQHQIPVHDWFGWLVRRIRERGFLTLIGHLALSTYLRLARLRDRMLGRSLWRSLGMQPPTWKGITAHFAWREQQIIDMLGACDVIILFDAYRLSHRFFRRLQKPCLQVAWGMSPNYMGDSGAFWAYALGDTAHVGASVLLRSQHFSTITVVSSLLIDVTDLDTLRSIKIKQVKTLAQHLPIITHVVGTRKTFLTDKRSALAQHYYAPTLWTYLRVMATGPQHTLPTYARRTQPCTLTTLAI